MTTMPGILIPFIDIVCVPEGSLCGDIDWRGWKENKLRLCVVEA